MDLLPKTSTKLPEQELQDTQRPIPPTEFSPATPTPPETFPLFPFLFPELRLQIWRSALQVPRLITISSPSTAHTPNHPTYRSAQTFHIHRSAPCPLLAVNREARSEALRFHSSGGDLETGARAREAYRRAEVAGDDSRGAGKTWMDRLPYHAQHKCSTRGYYQRPGDDIIYLQGTYYDSRLFRGVSQVAREVVVPGSGQGKVKSKYPVVGPVRKLAIDEAFLSDERLFGRPEVSPVMVLLMRDLKGLEDFIVVRGEGAGLRTEEIEEKIEGVRQKLVEQCRLWGFEREVKDLETWKMPLVRVVNRGKLREECGAFGQ